MKTDVKLVPQSSASKDTPYFDKTTTNIIKGIALIMMFVHHAFTFPEWWLEDAFYPTALKLAPYFCVWLKICVPIFCFLTGYFYYFTKRKNYGYSFRKISDVLITYWIVFALFAILAVCCVRYQYTPLGVLREMFALDRPTMIFCWYVLFYIIVMLLLPLVVKLLVGRFATNALICFILIPFLSGNLMNWIAISELQEIFSWLQLWFPCVLMGYLFAKHNLFQRIFDKLNGLIKLRWLNITTWMFFAVLAVVERKYQPSLYIGMSEISLLHFVPAVTLNLDILYAPVFVGAVANICKQCHFKPIEVVLGQSENILY